MSKVTQTTGVYREVKKLPKRLKRSSQHYSRPSRVEKEKKAIFTLTPALVYADTKSALKLSIVYLSAADIAEELIRNTEYPHR